MHHIPAITIMLTKTVATIFTIVSLVIDASILGMASGVGLPTFLQIGENVVCQLIFGSFFLDVWQNVVHQLRGSTFNRRVCFV
jgi:hypothetical protein